MKIWEKKRGNVKMKRCLQSDNCKRGGLCVFEWKGMDERCPYFEQKDDQAREEYIKQCSTEELADVFVAVINTNLTLWQRMINARNKNKADGLNAMRQEAIKWLKEK